MRSARIARRACSRAVHSNYHFTYPGDARWPQNKSFVERYLKRWKEYPNSQVEGAYTALNLLKTAIEPANKLAGGWPDDVVVDSGGRVGLVGTALPEDDLSFELDARLPPGQYTGRDRGQRRRCEP